MQSQPFAATSGDGRGWGSFLASPSAGRRIVPLPTEEVTRVYAGLHPVTVDRQPNAVSAHRFDDTNNTTVHRDAFDPERKESSRQKVYCRPKLVLGPREPSPSKKKQNLVAIIRRTPNMPQSKGSLTDTFDKQPAPEDTEIGASKSIDQRNFDNGLPSVDGKLKVTPKLMRRAQKNARPATHVGMLRPPGPSNYYTGTQIRQNLDPFDDQSWLVAQNERNQGLVEKPAYNFDNSLVPRKPPIKPVCILGVSKKPRKPKRKPEEELALQNTKTLFWKTTDVGTPRESRINLRPEADADWSNVKMWQPYHPDRDRPEENHQTSPEQSGIESTILKAQTTSAGSKQQGIELPECLLQTQPLQQPESPAKPKKERPKSDLTKKPPAKSRYGLTKKKLEIPTYKIGWFKVKFPKLELERLEEIGRGGFGVVYRGTDLKTGKEVAIKYFDKRALKDSTKRKTLQKEVDALYNCDHPNVIKLIRVGETESCLNFVFDFWGQTNLAEYLKKRTIQLKEVKAIMVQIIEAISYLHARGIYHRDIKCENIMIRKSTEAKSDSAFEICLIDFGLAAIDSQQLRKSLFSEEDQESCESLSDSEERRRLGPRDGDICGTRYSMSPEMLKADEPYYLAPNDVWGLGVLFYFLLTSGLPFGVSGRFIITKIPQR